MDVVIVDTFDPDVPPTRIGPPDPEPTPAELAEARRVCARVLTETKARHVRTPEGARLFNQPIGSLIVADVPTTGLLDHVARVVDDALTHDKKITADVTGAILRSGGTPEGLDKRVKRSAAVAHRVMRNQRHAVARGEAPDLALAADGVPDALRYTAVFDDKGYTAGAITLMKALNALGYRSSTGGYGNTWYGSGYRGFNLRLEDRDGYGFELQIHTPASYAAKRDSHPLYVSARGLPDGPEKTRIAGQMRDIARAVPIPPGAGGLSWRGERARRKWEPSGFLALANEPLPPAGKFQPDIERVDELLDADGYAIIRGDTITDRYTREPVRVISLYGDGKILRADGVTMRASDARLHTPVDYEEGASVGYDAGEDLRNVDAEDELQDYLDKIETLSPVAATVMSHGEWYLPQQLPDGYERGEPKMCFVNAWRLAMADDTLTYVEGFAAAEIGSSGGYFPTHHAWCVDADGRVVDPTWSGTPAPGAAYFGIPFKTEAIARRALDTGVYGYLSNRDASVDEDDIEHTEEAFTRGWRTPERSRWLVCSDGVRRWGELGAAGALFRNVDAGGTVRYLLAKRGRHSDRGGTWSTPGGAIDVDETPLDAALREVAEEFGGPPPAYELVHSFVAQPVPEWAYTTHIFEVDERFTPTKLDWETETTGWFTAEELAQLELHPGFAASLAALSSRDDTPPSGGVDGFQHVAETPVTVIPDPGDTFNVQLAYEGVDSDTAHRIRKRKAAVKFYAKRRDNKNADEAQALADAYERAALLEHGTPAAPQSVTGVKVPAKATPKKVDPWAPIHPPSGRPDPYADLNTRGGDGPLPGGYSVGQRVTYGTHGALKTPYVIHSGKTTTYANELWAAGAGGEHKTSKLRHERQLELVDPAKPDKKPFMAPIDEMFPEAPDVEAPRLDPGYRVEPHLAAVDAASLPLNTLLPADSLDAVRQLLKRRAVALDTKTDSYQGFYVADLAALEAAKGDGLRTLGTAFGFTPAETDEAVDVLDKFLFRWAMTGDVDPTRLRMMDAMKALRAGEPADTPDRRALLLQKAWSNATWDARYDRDAAVPVGRYVTGHYAAQFEALDALTKPYVDYEGHASDPLYKREDVTVNAWPLTSWSVTPGGVLSGWIGRWQESVELTKRATRDETWLNVWSEPQFRSRGLKAPGEFIIDDRRELNLGDVDVTVHRVETNKPSNTFGGPGSDEQQKLAAALADHVRRHPDSTVEAGATGLILTAQGIELGTERFPDLGHLQYDAVAGSTAWAVPRRPQRKWRYRHRETGELYADPDKPYNLTPPKDERIDYEDVQVLERDDEREARLDAAAAVVSEKGWTYNQLSRYLDAWTRLGFEANDRLAYTHDLLPGFYPSRRPLDILGERTPETPEEAAKRYAVNVANSDATWAKTSAELQAAAKVLGYEPDLDKWLEQKWKSDVGDYLRTSLKPAPAKVAA